MKTERLGLIVLAGLAVVFGLGLVWLFELRFSAGDVYPPYSTLRSDPLGARAWYESLERLPQFRLQRNYRPLSGLGERRGQTVFLLGVPVSALTWSRAEDVSELEAVAAAGNRVVVTFLPVMEPPGDERLWKLLGENSESEPKPEPDRRETPRRDHPAATTTNELARVPLGGRWGFGCQYRPAATNALWHTALYFEKLEPRWRVVAARQGLATIIERAYGAGQIVLCADSYPVSNEALRRERHVDLLAGLVGRERAVVFDETHLGVREDPGVMTLARRYRLHGMLAVLLLLAGLFVWKNAASFVTAETDAADDGAVLAEGKDSAAGFVNLLRRSIRPSELVAVCVAEWKQSFAHRLRNHGAGLEEAERLAQVQRDLPLRERDPVGAYRAIAEKLKSAK